MEIEKCFSQIPLKLYGSVPVGVGRDCLVLIFFRAKVSKSLENIKIKDQDKKIIGLSRLSYYNGIEILVKHNIISVTKNNGSAYLITLRKERLEENTISFLLNGKGGGVTMSTPWSRHSRFINYPPEPQTPINFAIVKVQTWYCPKVNTKVRLCKMVKCEFFKNCKREDTQ